MIRRPTFLFSRHSIANPGFTLVEMAVTIGIVALITGVALLGFTHQDESQNATLANSVQAGLQNALGAMALRLERPAAQVFTNPAFRQRIVQFAQGSLGSRVTLSVSGSGVDVTFANSTLLVSYGVNAQGDITIQSENFPHFNVDASGRLAE